MILEAPEPRFEPWLALVSWVAVFVVGAVGSILIVTISGYGDTTIGNWPLWLVAVTFLPLWAATITVLSWVSRTYGSGRFRRDFGVYARPGDVVVGLSVGAVTQLVFVELLYKGLDRLFDTSQVDKPATELTDKATGLGVVVLIAVVAIGAPLIEELFFRGFVQRAIQARLNDGLALVITSAFFAAIHFQVLQFPGLMLFGLVAGYLAMRSRRIGPAVFAHIGFNAATVIKLLLER